MAVNLGIFDSPGILEDHNVTPGCEASEWSGWSSCSVTCGKGISMRTRTFLRPETEAKMQLGCDRQMVQKEMCSASVLLCEGKCWNLMEKCFTESAKKWEMRNGLPGL